MEKSIIKQNAIIKNKKIFNASNLSFKFSDNLTKTYTTNIETFLKEINMFGTIYFTHHFEWQSICREKFWFECIDNESQKSNLILITKEAYINYIGQTYPLQKITAYLNTFKIKNASASILLTFKDTITKKIVSQGFQTIAFSDLAKQIIKIPEKIKERLYKYSIEL